VAATVNLAMGEKKLRNGVKGTFVGEGVNTI